LPGVFNYEHLLPDTNHDFSPRLPSGAARSSASGVTKM
jgi:hypothetical protein